MGVILCNTAKIEEGNEETKMSRDEENGCLVETRLPKLPLPNINETMEKYLDAVVAYISPDDYERTKGHVKDFLSHEDDLERIKRFLEKRNEENANWAYRWWLEDMYLNNMLPLPVNSSPGWVFPRQNFDGRTELMHKYLARIMKGIAEFKQSLESETLEPEIIKSRATGSQPLCMEQFGRLVNAYRMPGSEGQDELICSPPTKTNDSEHVIVFANGYMYCMFVKMDGKWFSIEELQKGLNQIQEDVKTRMKSNPMMYRVQILTSDVRSTWAENREKLISISDSNKDMLSMIEKCLFVVCLDQPVHNLSDHSVSHQDMFKQMVTGHGCNKNGGNRWFDKTIQLVASLNGVNGICYEHTTSEGIAVVTMLQKILSQMENEDSNTNPAHESDIKKDDEVEKEDTWAVKVMDDLSIREKFFTKRIDWNINEEISEEILKAAEKYNMLDRNTDLEIYRYEQYGKNFMKTCNCSPDAYMQMVLQLSYYRIHGGLCATYESASTRRFQSGRVDCIRASHPEALAWVQSMIKQIDTDNTNEESSDALSSSEIKNEQKKLFMSAISKQTKVMTDNITGKGVDVPILGIRKAVNEIWNTPKEELSEEEIKENQHLRAIFDDQVFDTANAFKLSTSQVPIALKESYMGYGAVVPDGYGCSYNLQNDYVIFCIGSFFSCEETSSMLYAESLEESMNQMKEMFSDND